jgi:hypothetical protein
MKTACSVSGVKYHFGLNVTDLRRSVQFYRLLFGREPAKCYDDYAKFELDEPPLVMSLLPNPQSRGGTLNHLGFRLADSEALVEVQRRLELGGVATQREEGVECCYARQTKFWVSDPDRNLWEMYVFEEDIDHHGEGRVPAAAPTAALPDDSLAVWEHRLTQPFPERIPHADGSLDEVRFEGTWSALMAAKRFADLARQAFRVLKPGGRVSVHGLVADRPLNGPPALPGPAAVIQRVPLEHEPVAALEAAGFAGLCLDKLADAPCFVANGAELRELRLSGRKPSPAGGARTHTVIYKGPFVQTADEEGTVYRCGERVAVSEARWEVLRHGPTAADFVFLAPPMACCSPALQTIGGVR